MSNWLKCIKKRNHPVENVDLLTVCAGIMGARESLVEGATASGSWQFQQRGLIRTFKRYEQTVYQVKATTGAWWRLGGSLSGSTDGTEQQMYLLAIHWSQPWG